MPESSDFWDRMADGYAKKPVKDMASYNETLDRTRKHLSASDHVLEVGCGTGSTALLLAPSAAQITATDISRRMVEIAREKASTQGVANVRFEQATLFDEGLQAGSFDVVLGFNFLHLLEDLPGALRRVHELLKPGGRFVSKTVCLGQQSRLWAIPLALMRRLRLAPFVRILDAGELDGIVADAGFEIVESGFLPPPRSRFLVARKTSSTSTE